MIKKVNVGVLILLFTCEVAFSQHLSHQVMVPAAGLVVCKSLDYTQTIGETAIEIISCSGHALTQGFQQPDIEYVEIVTQAGNGVEVYPNPATDHIDIKLFGVVARKFRMEIINITGTIVSSTTKSFDANFYYIERIPVENLMKGLYYVRVISMDGFISRSFKIEKM